MSRPARYTIRAACALTGLNPNTLRAWERRYGLVRPERTPSGYRLYTANDLDRLKQIQALLEAGLPVSQAAGQLRTKRASTSARRASADAVADAPPPRARAARADTESPPRRAAHEHIAWSGAVLEHDALAASGGAPDEAGVHRARLRRAALAGDGNLIMKLFNRAVGLYSVRDAFDQMLLPAAGELRADPTPESQAAAELLAAFARGRLTAVLKGMRPLHRHPEVLSAFTCGGTLEDELMRLTLAIGLERVSVRYIGAQLSGAELDDSVELRSLKAVVVTCEADTTCEVIERLAERLSAHPRQPALLVMMPPGVADPAWLAGLGARVLRADATSSAPELLALIGRR